MHPNDLQPKIRLLQRIKQHHPNFWTAEAEGVLLDARNVVSMSQDGFDVSPQLVQSIANEITLIQNNFPSGRAEYKY